MMPRACPVCEATNAPLYHNRMAALDDLDMSYAVACCAQCGASYAAQLPPAADFTRYYTEYSKYDVVRERAHIPLLDQAIADGAVAFLRPHLPADASVFDVGCSVGIFLDACQRQGVRRVSGIDPAPQAGEVALRLFGIKVHTGFFDGSQSLAEWDVVSLISVLEHLWSPQNTLAALAKSMRVGALLYLEVPAGDRFGDIRGEVFGEFSLEHINYFGKVSLCRLAARFGFSLEACDETFYPNQTWGLRALFRLTGTIEPGAAFDEVLTVSVNTYVMRGQEQVQAQNALLSTLDTPVAIYGAGSHSARLLAYPAAQSLSVAALVDGNRNLQGKRLGGHCVFAPDILGELNVSVIISSYQSRLALARIVNERYGLTAVNLYP